MTTTFEDALAKLLKEREGRRRELESVRAAVAERSGRRGALELSGDVKEAAANEREISGLSVRVLALQAALVELEKRCRLQAQAIMEAEWKRRDEERRQAESARQEQRKRVDGVYAQLVVEQGRLETALLVEQNRLQVWGQFLSQVERENFIAGLLGEPLQPVSELEQLTRP